MKDYDSKKWYNKRVLVLLFLTVFMIWPLGLIGLYLSKSLSKYQKGLFVTVAIIYHSLFFNVLVPTLQKNRYNGAVELPSDPRPGDQITFEQTYAAIRLDYERSKGNELLRKEQADQAKTFLSTKRVINNWKGRVKEIYSSGVIMVNMFSYTSLSNSSNLESFWKGHYYLKYDDISFIKSLKVGDDISFSGQVESEGSWTDRGAMDDPEVIINVIDCKVFEL